MDTNENFVGEHFCTKAPSDAIIRNNTEKYERKISRNSFNLSLYIYVIYEKISASPIIFLDFSLIFITKREKIIKSKHFGDHISD